MFKIRKESLKSVAVAGSRVIGVPAAEHQNAALDEALAETFPASDPIAVDFTRINVKTSARKTG